FVPKSVPKWGRSAVAITLLRSRSQLLPRLTAEHAQSAIGAVTRPVTGAPTDNPDQGGVAERHAGGRSIKRGRRPARGRVEPGGQQHAHRADDGGARGGASGSSQATP